MKRMLYSILILICVTFLGLHPSTMEKAYAATEFYVDASDGDDAWPGTEAQPWKTITKAANTLTAGDTVFIRAGTYNEKVTPANSGNADNWITYAAYPGDTVTIDGTGIELDFWNGLFHIDGRDFIVVDGIRITNSELIGFLCMNADYTTVRNCYFTNTQSSGIHARENSSNITIHDNELFHTNTTYSQEGISITGVNGFEIFNNHVHEFPIVSDDGYSQCGIDAKKGSTNGSIHHNEVYSVRVGIYIDGFDQTNSNIDVYNNLVYDCQEVGIAINAEQGGTVENCNIYNNISHSNAYHGLKINDYGSSYSNISIINNTTYNNGVTPLQIARDVNVQNLVVRNNSFGCESGKGVGIYHPYNPAEHHFDHNLYQYEPYFGTDYQTGDPLYFDPANGDFRIGFGSPCIDNGDYTGAPSTDYEGIPRPQGTACDIGAYELHGIVFVDEDATGVNDGTSWVDAYIELQDALDTVEIEAQVWVAEGAYKPSEQTDPADPRTATFQMINNVEIYGGFDPSIGVDEFAERDWENNNAILSGDIGIASDNSDNCYHVFYHPDGLDLNSSAILDGFTISEGNSTSGIGSGMYNYSSSPTVTHCTFTGNRADCAMGNQYSSPTVTHCTFTGNTAVVGGGMYNYGSSTKVTNCTFTGNSAVVGGGMYNYFSSPTVTDCIFTWNTASDNAGGMYNVKSSPTVTNCTFTENTAGTGGGVSNSGSSPTLINCSFSGNSASVDGGGMRNFSYSSPTVTNCTFTENSATGNGGAVFSDKSDPVMTNCIFEANTADYLGGGICNLGSSLTLNDCELLNNSAVSNGGGMFTGPSFRPGAGGDDIVGSSLHLENCTFEGNSTDNNGGGTYIDSYSSTEAANCIFKYNSAIDGGGIYNFSGSPTTLTNCTFQENMASQDGGGICNAIGSETTLTNCIFQQNIALQNGGGVYNASALELTDCALEGNTASSNGGGVYNKKSFSSLTDCVLTSNSAIFGAGMYNLDSSPMLSGCTVQENTASDAGGGMFNTENSSPRITNSQYIGNTAPNYGGGMFNVGAGKECNPDVTNSIFTENESNFGGGIYNDEASPTVTNCTFTANSATTSGGGIHSYNNSLPVITNSIFWGNAANGISEFSSSSTVTYCDIEGGYTGEGNIDQDPLLTADFHIKPNSPCIDTGTNSAPNLPATDFEGDDRIINGTVDMGADEAPFVPDIIYVDDEAAGANNGSSWTDAFNDLQDGLDIAHVSDQIWVAAGIYKPSIEVGGTGARYATFQMKNGVGIYGGFDPSIEDDDFTERDWENNETILSGDIGIPGNNSDNSYHVIYDTHDLGLDSSAILDGFTITKGNANGGDNNNSSGGGMVMGGNCSPTVNNCTFVENAAANYGGGMTGNSSTITITNCVFSRNYAGVAGGGMNSGSWTITNCTFSGNTSGGSGGGGLYLTNVSPTITKCIFDGNLVTSSYGHGGGINMDASSPEITNCIFSDNFANHTGGGIFVLYKSSPTITNCTITGNSARYVGGIWASSDSTPSIINSVLWGNGNDLSGCTATYSNIEDGDAGMGNISSDPLLTTDFHLQPNSPCINMGTNSAPNLPTTDFEGDNRIINGTVDMGADEYAGPFTSSITGQVDLQGRAGSSGPDWVIDAAVNLWEVDADRSTAIPLATYDITTDETGAFTIPDITPGTYDITIIGSHTLRTLVEDVEITADSTTPVDFGTLIEGDCWGDGGPDNVIDGADYSAIIYTFGTSPGHPDFIESCDVNNDDVIDGLDYSIVLFNFGEIGVEPF